MDYKPSSASGEEVWRQCKRTAGDKRKQENRRRIATEFALFETQDEVLLHVARISDPTVTPGVKEKELPLAIGAF